MQSWSVQTSPSGFHAVIENTACAGKLILTYILQMPLHVTVIVLLKSRIPSAAEQLEFTAFVPFKKKKPFVRESVILFCQFYFSSIISYELHSGISELLSCIFLELGGKNTPPVTAFF